MLGLVAPHQRQAGDSAAPESTEAILNGVPGGNRTPDP